MPLPWEPLDKYELMDNMYMLDQQELDQLHSPGVDADVSRAALNEKIARSSDPPMGDSNQHNSLSSWGDYNELGERPDKCPECKESWEIVEKYDDGQLQGITLDGYVINHNKSKKHKAYKCDNCGEKTTGEK